MAASILWLRASSQRPPLPHQGPLIRCRVEIFGRATVTLGGLQFRVARIHCRATEIREAGHEGLHRFVRRRFNAQAEKGGLVVGAADGELFHFEAAARLHHRVEDLFHDVRIDQMAVSFDDFGRKFRHRGLFVHSSGPSEKQRQALFICVIRTVAVAVIHRIHIHLARAGLRIRDWNHREFPF